MEPDTREILCGLTYQQIIDVAVTSPNKRAAAKRLGVSYEHLLRVTKAAGMQHWFKHKKCRQRCISREDIIQVASEGYTRADAADILGVSLKYLSELVCLWGLAHHFPSRGKTLWINRRGYAHAA